MFYSMKACWAYHEYRVMREEKGEQENSDRRKNQRGSGPWIPG
jgi:hypothetical protein